MSRSNRDSSGGIRKELNAYKVEATKFFSHSGTDANPNIKQGSIYNAISDDVFSATINGGGGYGRAIRILQVVSMLQLVVVITIRQRVKVQQS